jgi:uncharacterized protein with ParB-like and HNH nuclease domain
LAPIADPGKRRQINQGWRSEIHGLISWGGVDDAENDAACIKAWLRAQYAETIRDREAGAADRDWELIGTVFHRWVRDNAKRLGVGIEQANIAFMADHFPFYARAWKRILDASRTYTKDREPIFYNAHNEFTWQNTVLLAPLVPTDSDEDVRRKMVAVATYLDIWIMRRAANYIRIG